MIWLALAALGCAAVPAAMFWANLRMYLPPDTLDAKAAKPAVSVLIPARDEEGAIGAAVESVLASVGVTVEVVVMDDASSDETASVVKQIAAREGRVRVESAPSLPAGWNGKQHACWVLAQTARTDILCFVDADVRVEPAALARMAGFLEQSGSGLVSGFPRQITETWMEWLLLPLIHFVLLGFLPLGRMRAGVDPSLAAGCGQFLMVRREAYFASGGHAAIRETMHDGLRLPRLLREHGFRTDLADLTGLARCRMYRNAGEVWRGLSKNATEGLAAPSRIVPVTGFLLLGQVAPFVMGVWLLVSGAGSRGPIAAVVAGVGLAWLPRALGVRRFRQSVAGAVMHPAGIVLLVALQWCALARKVLGRGVSWKTRVYSK